MVRKPKTREQKKKEANEDLDYLKQVEKLPEEAGRKFVVDKIKAKESKDKDYRDTVASVLQGRTDRITAYKAGLVRYGIQRLFEADLDHSYQYYCVPTNGTRINIFGKSFETKEGILVIIKSPKGHVYVRGITLTLEPLYDMNALDILVVQAENTVDSEKGLLLGDNRDTASTLRKTKGGIYLPD